MRLAGATRVTLGPNPTANPVSVARVEKVVCGALSVEFIRANNGVQYAQRFLTFSLAVMGGAFVHACGLAAKLPYIAAGVANGVTRQ